MTSFKIIFPLFSLLFGQGFASVCSNIDGSSPNTNSCTCGDSTCSANDYCLASATTAVGRCSYFPRCRSLHHNNLQECVKCDPDDDFKCLTCKKGNMLNANGICVPSKMMFTTKSTLEEESSSDDEFTNQGFFLLDLEKHIKDVTAFDHNNAPHPRAGNDGFVALAFASTPKINDLIAWGHPFFGGRIPGFYEHGAGKRSDVDKKIDEVHPPSIYNTDGTIVAREGLGDDSGCATEKTCFLARGLLNGYKNSVDCTINDVAATSFAFAALIDCDVASRYSVVVAWGDKEYGGLLNNRVKKVMYRGFFPVSDITEKELLYTQVRSVYSTCCAFAALLEDRSLLVWGNSDRGGSMPTSTVDTLKLAGGAMEIYSNNRAFVAVTSRQNTNNINDHDQILTWGESSSGGSLPAGIKKFFSDNSGINPIAFDWNMEITSVHHTGKAFVAVVQAHNMPENAKFSGNSEIIIFWGSDTHGGKLTQTVINKYKEQNIKKWDDANFMAVDDDAASNFFAPKVLQMRKMSSGPSTIQDLQDHYLHFYKKVRQITTTHSMIAVTLVDGTVFSFGGKPTIVASQEEIPHSFVSKTKATFMHTTGVRAVFGAEQSFSALLDDGSVVSWGRTDDFTNNECSLSCTCSDPFDPNNKCGRLKVDLSAQIGTSKVISLFSSRDTWSALSLVPTGSDKNNVAMFGQQNSIFTYSDDGGSSTKFVLERMEGDASAAKQISDGEGAKMLYATRNAFVALLNTPTASMPIVGWGVGPCAFADTCGFLSQGSVCCITSFSSSSNSAQSQTFNSGLLTFTNGGQTPSSNPWTDKIPTKVFSDVDEFIFYDNTKRIMLPGVSTVENYNLKNYVTSWELSPREFLYKCVIETGISGRSCNKDDTNWVGSVAEYTAGDKFTERYIPYIQPPSQWPTLNGPPTQMNGQTLENTWVAPCRLGYAPSLSTQKCTECEIGKVGPTIKAIAQAISSMTDPTCTPCHRKTSLGKNSVFCVRCSNGVGTTDENPQCSTCGSGKFAKFCDSGESNNIAINNSVVNRQVARCTQSAYPICLSCPENHYLGFDETSSTDKHDSMDDCVACPDGQLTGKLSGQTKRTGADYCSVCGAGRWTKDPSLSTRECVKCPVGWMQDESAQSNCKKCGSGQYQNLVGSAFCFQCSRGKHQPLEGKDDCIPCPINSYSRQAGASTCENCKPGRTTPSGSNACSNCGAGTKKNTFPGDASDSDDFKCVDCVKGTFTDVQGVTNCSSCPAGYSQELNAQGSCFPCSKGEYQNEESSSKCKLCPQSTYTDQTNQTVCKNCEPGKGAENAGSSRCEDCPAGRAGSPCADCLPGLYRNNGASDRVNCKNCLPGQYQLSHAQASCLQCVPGFYEDSKKSTGCKECQINTYQDETLQSTCKNCGTGRSAPTNASASCEACAAGQAGTPCSNCKKGKFRSSDMDPLSCDECFSGLYQNEVGQASCLPCIRTFFCILHICYLLCLLFDILFISNFITCIIFDFYFYDFFCFFP